MFKLEKNKLFKRRIIQVVITGIFLLVFVKEIFIHNTYKAYGPGVAASVENTGMLWQNFLMVLNGNLLMLPAFIVVSFSGIFSYENRCGMQDIILSTKNGRRECTNAKLQLAFIITNLVYAVIIFISVAHMFIVTKGTGCHMEIQTAGILNDSVFKADYMELVLHMVFLSFIAVNIVLLLVLLVSFLSKNTFVSICIILGILYIMRPDILSMFLGIDKAWYIILFSPVNSMNVLDIVRYAPVMISGNMVQWVYIIELVYSITLAAGIIFFNTAIAKRQKYYAT